MSFLEGRQVGNTSRRDAWWVSPAAVFLGFGAFIVYATWAAFQNADYTFGNYISPFYSPEIFGDSPHALLGSKPGMGAEFSALFPRIFDSVDTGAGSGLTCYYYRGAYYKAFWADPPACAVGEPRKTYIGERSFPLILQNFHRYFLRLSVSDMGLYSVYDAIKSFVFPDGFGIGVGRHRAGGERGVCWLDTFLAVTRSGTWWGGTFDQISEHPVRHKLYDCVSCLNRGHKRWAWASLFWVAFSDVYVRLCSMGIWHDGDPVDAGIRATLL